MIGNNRTDIATSQNELEKIETHVKSPSVILLVLLATLGALLYASFLFTPENRGDLLPYALAIVAESFILFQAILALWTILAGGHDPRGFEFHRTQDHLFSQTSRIPVERVAKEAKKGVVYPLYLNGRPITVDVFVTVYGEELDVIRETVLAAKSMIGKHHTYILDDGKSDEVYELAQELKAFYIRRKNNDGAKAGNINTALRHTEGDFFVIFDADFVPSNRFLYETVPFFEDASVAFVQTPQHYNNMHNLISKGAGYMQHVFYALIQTGKNRFNAAFCVGTNVAFRRSAIESIGGMYQKSKSEDIWTSILLHEKGYRSVYIPNVLAIGKTPETIKTYSKQQLRWATGGFEIFFRHNPLFRRGLTMDQKLQYFGTSTYYFNGLAVMLLLTLPPLLIFFNLTPVSLSISTLQWAFYYSSFYLMQILVAFYIMGGFKLQTLMLANASAVIYVKALFNAFFKREQTWQATGRVGKIDSPFNYIRAQVYIFVFLLLTTVIGVWKSLYTDEVSVALFWNTINTIVFGSFFFVALREARRAKKQKRAEKKLRKLEQRNRKLELAS